MYSNRLFSQEKSCQSILISSPLKAKSAVALHSQFYLYEYPLGTVVTIPSEAKMALYHRTSVQVRERGPITIKQIILR